MAHLARRLPVALILGLLSLDPLTGQVSDKARTVQDEAGLFSKEAKDKANQQIARIKHEFKKDLLIETVKSIPFPEGLSKDDAANLWAAKRSEALTDGVYLGIILDPPKYRVHVGPGAVAVFNMNNRKELETILVNHLKAKEFDQALINVTDFVYEMMRRNGLLASGMQVMDAKVGNGPGAKRGDTLTIHYIGRLKDGKTFDKTLDPFTFILKEGVLIKGFEQGLIGMKAGGVRKLVVPAVLGYGKEGVGDIPPGAELHFEIELLKIR